MVDLQRDLDAGMQLHESGEHARGEIFSGGACCEPQATGAESAQIGKTVFGLLEFPENFPAGRVKFASRIRQVRAFAELLEQRQTDGVGKLFDLYRDGGLRHIEFFRGARITPEPGNRLEYA